MARRGNNEGTIFKKANGKWRAQVSIEGKRISITAGSRSECNEWLRKMLDQIDRGLTIEGRNITLGDYLEEWIKVKKTSLRERTGFQYERLITLYIAPGIGKLQLKDLSLRLINQFYGRLLSKGIAVSNIRYAHRVLHAALENALSNGLLGRNPAHGATLPKKPYKEMSILNENQVNTFLVVANSTRFHPLFHLAITTGMRFSELRGLYWSDVDWIKATITVRRQIHQIHGQGPKISEPKTHSGIRIIRIGEKSLEMLREQKKKIDKERIEAGNNWSENGLIFPSKVGTPFIPVSVQNDFHKAIRDANLPHIRFHDLRHTAASLMLSHGVPALVVSKILGHSSPSITLGIYAHTSLDMQDQAADVMDEIVSPIEIIISQLHPVAPGRSSKADREENKNRNTA